MKVPRNQTFGLVKGEIERERTSDVVKVGVQGHSEHVTDMGWSRSKDLSAQRCFAFLGI